MRRFVLMVCAAAVILGGCVKSETGIVFNGDRSIDAEIVYTLAKNSGATDEAIESVIEGAGEQLDAYEISYSTYSDDEAYYIDIPLRFDSVYEMTGAFYFEYLPFVPTLTGSEEDGKINVYMDPDGNLEVSGVMNAESFGFSSITAQAGMDESAVEARFSLTLPDGEREEWSIVGGEEKEIDFKAENIYGDGKGQRASGETGYGMYIGAGVAAVIVIAATALILMRKKKSAKEPKA